MFGIFVVGNAVFGTNGTCVGGRNGIVDGSSEEGKGRLDEGCCVRDIKVIGDGVCDGGNAEIIVGDCVDGKEELGEGSFVVLGYTEGGSGVKEFFVVEVGFACKILSPDITALPIIGVISMLISVEFNSCTVTSLNI
jgi:hypothetical protein